MQIETRQYWAVFDSRNDDIAFGQGPYFEGDFICERIQLTKTIATVRTSLSRLLEEARARMAHTVIEVGQIRSVTKATDHPKIVHHHHYLLLDLAIAGSNSLRPIRWQHVGYDLIERFEVDSRSELYPEILSAVAGEPIEELFECPVLLLPYTSCQLVHECIGHTSEADNYIAYAAPSGYEIGHRWSDCPISVFDDPTIPGLRSSFAVDDEGMVSRRTALVTNGIWTGVLSDSSHADRAGFHPGHARRTLKSDTALPRMSNTWMSPGNRSVQDLISQIDRGLLCGGTWGGGSLGLNFIIRPAYGRVVEDGTLTQSYRRRFDLIGEKFSTISRISGIGDHTKWYFPYYGCDKFGQDNLPVSFGAPAILLDRCEVCPIP